MWYLIYRQPKKENIQIGETYVYKETTSYESEIHYEYVRKYAQEIITI